MGRIRPPSTKWAKIPPKNTCKVLERNVVKRPLYTRKNKLTKSNYVEKTEYIAPL